MAGKPLENVDFSLIRYANCWEDPEVLLQGLKVQPGSSVMSVASAGDNTFSLLTAEPEKVIAVDVSKVQLFLTELKMLAIQKLSRSEFLAFMGFTENSSRLRVFQQLKSELKPETRAYWETPEQQQQLAGGIIYQGKFEKFFRFFSRRVMPLIHPPKRIKELYRRKSAEEQALFYDKHWDNWRWRLMFRLFFNKFVMGKYGRDPAFLKHVKLTVSQYVRQTNRQHLRTVHAQTNPFLHFMHTGNFGPFLPHYVREGNYEKIQANISCLVLFEGLLDDALKEHPDIAYFNLSNIFEYMDEPLFKEVVSGLLQHSAPEAKFAYWNLMIRRRFDEIFPDRVHHLKAQSDRLNQMDKGFFYLRFMLDQKK